MKKRVTAVLTGVLCLSLLAGCGSSNQAYLEDIKAEDFVTLGQYSGLTIETDPKPEMSKAQLASQVNSQLYAQVTEVTDRPVQEGDQVHLSYSGRYADTGKEFDGGTSDGYDLVIGSGSFIPGFEEGLIGMKKGESGEIPLTFPKDYASAPDLAGKDVIFKVEVKTISVPTDAYAKGLGIDGVTDAATYKKYLEKQVQDFMDQQYDSQVGHDVLDAVMKGCTYKNPPKALCERIKKKSRAAAEQMAAYYGQQFGQSITADQYLQAQMSQQGFTGELEDMLDQQAVQQAEQMLTLKAIADKEGIQADYSNLGSSEESLYSSYGYSTPEEYNKALGSDVTRDVQENAFMDQVLTWLQENNTLTEKQASVDDGDAAR